MIAIIDYGINNLESVRNALNKLVVQTVVTNKREMIQKADALILPGVGAAAMGMKNLKERKLDKIIINDVRKGKPILGICLGMQLLFSKSEEGNVRCLNIIEGRVKKFKFSKESSA